VQVLLSFTPLVFKLFAATQLNMIWKIYLNLYFGPFSLWGDLEGSKWAGEIDHGNKPQDQSWDKNRSS
jgi:hypothetical protein